MFVPKTANGKRILLAVDAPVPAAVAFASHSSRRTAMKRRDVLKAAGGAAVAGVASGMPALLGCGARRPTDKRQLVLDLLDPDRGYGYVPAGFFIHFAEEEHAGQAAVDRHVEFFRFTGMDFVKIQYEAGFPPHPEIETPADWAKLPVHGKEFYEAQVAVVEGLVKALKKEAIVVCTLYSPFMLAGESMTPERVVQHIEEDPEAVRQGLEKVTESLLVFVRECARVGVDGFYASTQGGETGRFTRPELFQEVIQPSDLVVQNEINDATLFNILHVCDYHLPYDDLTPFRDYPGDVVNCSLHVGTETWTPKRASEFFGRPFMGGLERKGIVASGTPEEIQEEVRRVLAQGAERQILGADCTLPKDIDWENIRTAIGAAHEFRA
jgi:uroporphyrinogen decarboxylase